MPAIQLARLKLQAAHLRDSFSRPDAFVRGFHAMLGFYADRTHRRGQSGVPAPLTSAYHVPAPVLRQVFIELQPQLQSSPEGALELSDALWAQTNLECRLLAASILGGIPTSHAREALARVAAWSREESDHRLIDALLNQGLQRTRRESTEMLLGVISGWLNSENLHDQRMGLRALRAFLGDPSFGNLPAIFSLLKQLTRGAPAGLRNDLMDVLNALVERSPSETAFFLKETMESPQSLDTHRLVRKLLPVFPPEIREGLRETLRKIGK